MYDCVDTYMYICLKVVQMTYMYIHVHVCRSETYSQSSFTCTSNDETIARMIESSGQNWTLGDKKDIRCRRLIFLTSRRSKFDDEHSADLGDFWEGISKKFHLSKLTSRARFLMTSASQIHKNEHFELINIVSKSTK